MQRDTRAPGCNLTLITAVWSLPYTWRPSSHHHPHVKLILASLLFADCMLACRARKWDIHKWI